MTANSKSIDTVPTMTKDDIKESWIDLPGVKSGTSVSQDKVAELRRVKKVVQSLPEELNKIKSAIREPINLNICHLSDLLIKGCSIWLVICLFTAFMITNHVTPRQLQVWHRATFS